MSVFDENGEYTERYKKTLKEYLKLTFWDCDKTPKPKRLQNMNYGTEEELQELLKDLKPMKKDKPMTRGRPRTTAPKTKPVVKTSNEETLNTINDDNVEDITLTELKEVIDTKEEEPDYTNITYDNGVVINDLVITDNNESIVELTTTPPVNLVSYKLVEFDTHITNLEQLTNMYCLILRQLFYKNIITLTVDEINNIANNAVFTKSNGKLDVSAKSLYMSKLLGQKMQDIKLFDMTEEDFKQLPLHLQSLLTI